MINQPPVESLTVISQGSKASTFSRIMDFTHALPEYPSSDIYGYTYVIPSGGRSQEEIKKIFAQVNYLHYFLST